MFRAFASLALAALLALALGAAGFARGLSAAVLPPAAGFEMVICAEEGARTIHVDARGEPLPPADEPCLVHCPDCLVAGASGLAALPAQPAIRGLSANARASFAREIESPFRHRALPEARGPPTKAPA